MKSIRKKKWWSILLSVLSCSLAGCAASSTPEKSAMAGISALVTAPPDGSGQCIEETVKSRVNGRTVTAVAQLGAPGDETSVTIHDAPAGDVELTARITASFTSGACSGAVTWVADAILLSLVPGESRAVKQHLRSRADIAVTPDYEMIHVVNDNCPRTPIASPPASAEHALAYDAGRGLVVLLSSADGTTTSAAAVYEFDVAKKAWSRVETAGPAPTARTAAGFAYDRKTGLFVLFGGADNSASGQPRDIWEYGSCTWRDRTPATLPSDWPSARWAPAMTFDFASQRVVMTTGLQHFTYQWEDSAADGTVYEWDSAGGTFVARAPLGTPPTNRGAAVASGDPNRRVVYLVSGLQEGENPSSPSSWDTKLYVWDGAAGTWSVRQPAGAPSAREFAAGYFDTVADRFVVAGGVWYGWLNTPDYNQYDATADTWSSIGPDAAYNRFWSPIAFDEAHGVGIQFSGEIADTVYYGSGPSNAPADTRQFEGGAMMTLTP